MAIGFPPNYAEHFPLNELTPQQFLIIAIEAAKEAGWNISVIHENGFTAYTRFSMSSYAEEVTLTIDEDEAVLKSECTGNQLIDWGKNKKNINQFEEAFGEARLIINQEDLAARWDELRSGLEAGKQDETGSATKKTKLGGVFAIFIPQEGYFITPILINLNIAVFILMTVSGVNIMLPDTDSLIKWGANLRPVTLEGGWWRLITCCFVHIGIVHLLLNMYALLYVGMLLEPYLGKQRFLVAYLLTGIVASLASLCWHDLTVSAGASGAIFGLYGVFLAMLSTNLIEKSARQALLTSIGIFVVYNLVNGLKGGIDNAAHIGGLVSGLIIGYAFYPGLKNPISVKLKYLPVLLSAMVVLFASFIVFKNLPNDIGKYDMGMEKFRALEEEALKVYHLPEGASEENILSEIRQKGIPNWKESMQLLRSLDNLELPAQVHAKNEKLIRYCEIRIDSYKLMDKAISENSDHYQEQIDSCNASLEKVINSLKQ